MSQAMSKSILAVAVTSALLAGAAWSQTPSQEEEQTAPAPTYQRPGPRGMRGATPWAQFNLTDEQKERLRTLREEGAKAGQPLRTDLRTKETELRELMRAEEPNREAIQQKLREVSEARLALQQHRLDQRLALRSVLTPEQRSQLRRWRPPARARQWMPRGRMGRFGRGRPCRGCGYGRFGRWYGPGAGFGWGGHWHHRRHRGFGPRRPVPAPPPAPPEN